MTETPGIYNVEGDRPEHPPQPSTVRLDTKLDLLIEQRGRLTEGLTEFRVTMQEGFTSHDIRLDRIVEATERQATVAERQALTIERQSLAIERLALILERQIRGEG